MATTPTPFKEPYRNVQDLVRLMVSRGLTVGNAQKAERYLSTIGYYRLSAYMVPLMAMPKSLKQFKPSASFNQVMMLYRFERSIMTSV